MSALRQSIRSLGIPHPETAIAAHSAIGSDPAVLAHTGDLPQTPDAFPAWIKSTVLNGKGPLFERFENAVPIALGEKPEEETERLLRLLAVRPRTVPEIARITKREDFAGELERLAEAGLARTDPNPLEPELPFWTMGHRPARFYYAVMERYLPQWRRGYIADRLWGWTRARFRRYCCRPEFVSLAREWALGDPRTATTTRILVPDPEYRQMRTLELAAWDEQGGLVAIGTVRWGLRMRERQLKRLRYIKRLLGDPPVRLYCIAPRVDPAIAADPDPNLFRVGPELLLRE